MTKEEILIETQEELNKIFSQYKSRGLTSIYLWGSITTDDFDSQKSDIDSIGIIETSDMPFDESPANIYLENGKMKEHHLKLNYLYKDELDGKRIKSGLAKVIGIELLLFDFPYWTHVAGKKFRRSDFKLNDVTSSEAAKIEASMIRNRYLPFGEDYKDYVYFLKAVARLCYYLQQTDHDKVAFSYSGLAGHKNDLTKNAVDAILAIRAKDWDLQMFKEKLSILQDLVENLR